MKVTVEFYAEKLPVAYRLGIVSIIKECLKKGDEEAYLKFFSANQPKPYAFSVYMSNFQYIGDEIRLRGFRLNLTSSDISFVIPFLNGLQRTENFQYKDFQFKRGLIQYGRVPTIRSSQIIVKTNSPLLVEDASGTPLAPTDPTYAEHFNTIASKMSISLRGTPLSREIQLQPLNTKKNVVKETNHTYDQAFREGKTSTPNLYFTAYHGTFKLEGDPRDLQWLLETGGGLRNGQGFGQLYLQREVMADHEA